MMDMSAEMGTKAATLLINLFQDTLKTTFHHSSYADAKKSWGNASNVDREAINGKKATNNDSGWAFM